jgi:NitT/TauT family transport system substrate-binding protein
MKRLFRLTSIFGLVALISAGMHAPAFSAESKAVDKVKLCMNWIPYADYAMYVIGIKNGFYKKQGIEVEMVPSKGSDLCTKLIGSRYGDFGSASADEVLISRTKGMPLKVLAVMHQSSPVGIFSLKKIGIEKPKDLEGKSLASDPSSMKHKQFEAFCKLNGIDISKITILPIKGSSVVHILEGKADAMLLFDYIGDALLRKKGHDVNEIKLRDHGVDLYSISLITNDNLIKENPDLVRRFVSATMESWKYAVEHPQEAVDAFIEAYPELTKEDQAPQIYGVISLMQNQDTLMHGLGYQSKEKWSKIQDFLYDLGMVEKKISSEQVCADEFLK